MMIRRRDFLALAGAAAAFPRVAFGQQAAKVPRVVFLSTITAPDLLKSFMDGLTALGWIDGKNIAVDILYIPTTNDAPAFAAQAVASKPDVILALGRPAAPAAMAATTTIPIVFTDVSVDPVAAGLVSSLAHPGGNVTGNFNPEVTGKRLQYLKQLVPDLKHFAYLHVPEEDTTGAFLAAVQATAPALGLEPVVVDFVIGPDFTTQFDRVVAAGVKAVFVGSSAYCVNNANLIFDLTVKNKIVGVGAGSPVPLPVGQFVPSSPTGNVLMYGVDVNGEIRRSATFVDAILKGAKPSNLPVEIPTTFVLAVNLDAAKKIGLTIPPSVLNEATVIIDYDTAQHRL